MAAVKGKPRERQELVKETGFFEGKVLAINPDKETLEKLLNVELEKDPEYLGEDDKGNKKLNLVFWVQDVKSKRMRSLRFFLKDVVRQTQVKDGDTKPQKTQYINSIGVTTWSDNKENLPEWFISRSYRAAHEGEDELYKFVKDWLSDLDTRDAEACLSFDWGKFMRGDVSELRSEIGGEYESNVCLLTKVKTVEKEGEKKEYEEVHNRDFLPGYVMKQIKLKKIDKSFIEAANAAEKKKRTRLQKFVLSVTDSQFGIRDFYTLGELEAYDPSKNPVAGDKVLNEEDTSY